MTKNFFHWTKEEYGYVLRDSRGYARSMVTSPNRHRFYGTLFVRGLPVGGPYKSRKEAADWLTSTLVRLGHLPPNSTFEQITKGDRKMPPRRSKGVVS